MATYYFSTSGNNTTGAGTAASPWYSYYGKKNGVDNLSAGDICLFKAGDIWYGVDGEIEVLSSGTSGNPIIFDRYGDASAADPIFCGSSIQSTWSAVGTSTDAGGGTIYRKSGLNPYAYTIGVDGTSALCWNGNEVVTGAVKKGSFCYSGGYTYINLADGGNPSGHTIYVPGSNWWNDSYYGHISSGTSRTSNGGAGGKVSGKGNYVEFNHLTVLYPNRVGFSSGGLDVRFNDCTAIGCQGDGFLFSNKGSGTAQGTEANRCIARYCSTYGTGGGQAFTARAARTWFINCTAEYNFMAGFDFIDAAENGDDPYDCGIIYSTSYYNGQTVRAVNYDPGIYIDGAHDTLVYGNVVHGVGVGNQSSREPIGIAVSTEHQSRPTYNNHIINNLVYDCRGYGIEIKNGGDYPAYNNAAATYGNTIVNNTVIRKTGGYGACYRVGGLGTSVKTIIKNNIWYTSDTAYPISMWTTIDPNYVTMDYNCYYDSTGRTTLVSTGGGSPGYTLAQLQATPYFQDTHSINANPQLVNTTPATLDAHLTVATTPCDDAGTSSPWTPPAWIDTAGVLANDGAVVGTTRPDGVVDSGTLDMGYHYYAPTPYGTLTSTNIQPATLYLGSTNTVTASFTTATAWPADGTLVITFPTTLGGGFTFNSGGTSTASFSSGGSGSLTLTSVGSVMTLTRSGGSVISASTPVVISITRIQNPPQTGSTGAYWMKTTTSAGTSIDVDLNVSADQIIAPASSYKAITLSGVTVSGISFS